MRGKFGALIDFDDWLDGWSMGAVRRAAEESEAQSIFFENRPRNEQFEKIWLDLQRRTELKPKPGDKFDAVVVLQDGRADDLRRFDPDEPFAFVACLNRAAERVRPGGYLIWTQYVDFPDDDQALTSPIEPAALYQSFILRGFRSPIGDTSGATRMAIYNHPDTIYLSQAATLSYRNSHHRVSKVLCALRCPT
jgi:hypothetical protein